MGPWRACVFRIHWFFFGQWAEAGFPKKKNHMTKKTENDIERIREVLERVRGRGMLCCMAQGPYGPGCSDNLHFNMQVVAGRGSCVRCGCEIVLAQGEVVGTEITLVQLGLRISNLALPLSKTHPHHSTPQGVQPEHGNKLGAQPPTHTPMAIVRIFIDQGGNGPVNHTHAITSGVPK